MKALTGLTTCKLKNETDLKKTNPSSFTATISGVDKVYSLFPGTVLFLGYYKGMGTLTVAVSNHEIVRYLNLNQIQDWTFAELKKGDYIGTAYKQSGLQFEYATQWKGESPYPVRVKNNLFFKQNPIDILEGKYTPTREVDIQPGITLPRDKVEFTEDQLKEWGVPSIDNKDYYIQGAGLR